MRVIVLVVLIFAVILLIQHTKAWSRRRRRRSCYPGCVWSGWGSWGSCSVNCGGGNRWRSRYARHGQGACGARCTGPSYASSSCNTHCCRVDCSWYWSSWSPCSGCGMSNQTRRVVIWRRPSCGGTACPSTASMSRSCDTGVCCPVNCVVNNWGSWGACNAACEQTGKQTRTRTVRTKPFCKGTACPTLVDTKSCRGGCCRRNCLVSSWSAWSKCNAPSGKCGANAGTRSRSRQITRQPSCGGSACPPLSQSGQCTPVPISCTVSSWSSFTRCTPTNGKCGPGTQYRTRRITRNPYCSRPCPSLKEIRSCSAGCCPVNCAVSSWSSWSACSSTCGTGTKTRTRRITRNPSCNGQACPSLRSTTSCSLYNNKDCVMSAWSSWSQCSNGCGTGLVTKTRRIISHPVCQGTKCGSLSASKACTSYRDNRDCKVGSWGAWGSCSTKCAVGTRQRTRSISVTQRCRGRHCPSLRETSRCGLANGGCQQVCSNNVCSCRPGYNLGSDRKTCIAKNCGTARPTFCAQGTKKGSTCKYAIVSCPNGKTTYPVTCSLGCSKYYSLKGVSTITCQTSGLWTSYSSTFCRRNNDPPTQILLSGSNSVAENKPRGTKIGTLSSIDPVSLKDTHTYSIVKGGNGLFEIKGADLLALKPFNFESLPNSFDVTIRSTDNGVPVAYLDKTFTIKITDINESPTDIQLSSTSVNENSDVDTIVGMLTTADPDKSQSFTYLLLDNAGRRFKLVNNSIKVAQSNRQCLQSGSKCALNYELQKSHVIKVRSTDSGSPSKSLEITFFINVNDVNDQPRDLKLSNQTIKENAPINSVIGQFTALDEDTGQRLLYSLTDDDNGRFKVVSGQLLKAKDTDYETSKVHSIVARVTDNGKPAMTMTKKFPIIVLNENDAPTSVSLDKAAIKENSSPGTKVATVTAIDTDAVQYLTFRLDDDAGGKFALINQSTCRQRAQNDTLCTTKLNVSGKLDYEDAQWETIIIRATDNKGKFIIKNINITIVDVNDRPSNLTLEGSLVATVTENNCNIEIGELQTLDQDLGQTFTYTLLTNGSGNFETRGSKLYITKSANLDYEKKSSFRLSVRSTDSGKPQYSIQTTLTIYIKDLNEAPTDIMLSNATVVENTPTGNLIGNLLITDPDNVGQQGYRQRHTCQLTNSANRMIGRSMNGNINQLTVGIAGVNFEAKNIVGIMVECRDPGGLSIQKAFDIEVLDVNEAPSKIVVSNLNVKENQAIPTTIGKISVTDPDNEQIQRQTFTLQVYLPSPGIPGLSLPFDVQNGSLVVVATLDFESKPSFDIVLRATDNGTPPMFKSEQFTVQVLDTNDCPTNIQISNAFVDENSAQDKTIGTLSTTDEDTTQSYTYACIDCSNGRFKIDNAELKVAQSNQLCLSQGGAQCRLNYETTKKYSVQIQSTDSGIPPCSFNVTLDVIIRDVNDQPRELYLSNNKVKENATINALIGHFTARDEDVGQILMFSLVDDDNGSFRVDSSGNLYKANETNYETQNTHNIRVAVTDNGSPAMKMEKTFVIEVQDVNEPPVSIEISSSNGQIPFPINSPRVKENSPLTTTVGTVVALDADVGQNLTFDLDDDASGIFVLHSKSNCISVTNLPGFNTKCTSLIKLNGTLNYEQKKAYTIIVRVTDNHELFKTQKFTVDIFDVNEKPTNITLGAFSVNENANGALVGTMSTIDEDLGQSYVYTLADNASGRFEIRGNKLYVSDNANLDFETQSQHKIFIQVQDSGAPPLSFSKGFLITVNDLNEAPSFVNLSNYHVIENSNRGTVIGLFSVRDPDNLGPKGAVQSHFYRVVGSQIGQFVVQNNTLKIGSAVVNFEKAPIVNVEVCCSDNGTPSLSLTQTVQIIVDDVNETPKNISLSSSSVLENSSPSFVGTLSTNDPDNEFSARQSFSYRIVGSHRVPFIIDGTAINTTRPLDFETETSWTLTILSTDNGEPPKNVTYVLVVTVVDVNEQPTVISLSKSTVEENSDRNTIIGFLSSQDPDTNQKHTYTLDDTASGRFKIEKNKLKIAMSNSDCLKYGGYYCQLDFEAQPQYLITVRCTDNGIPPLSKVQSFSINVTDANDRPRNLTLSGYTVVENATIGTRIGLLKANDEDAGQVLSFSLINDDNGRFAIDRHNYLFKAKKTDYESRKIHVVTVKVKDNGSRPLELIKNITIFVLDINEAPINTSITSNNGQQSYPDNSPRVNENSPMGTTVGTFVSLDHDEVQSLKFTLVDDGSEKFTVSPISKCQNLTDTPGVKSSCSAKLYVNGTLNYEHSRSEDIIVKVTDPMGSSHSQKFTIDVLDVNDSPSDITLSGGYVAYVDENANNALVGDLAATDEDYSQTHWFLLVNNGGWKFVIMGGKVYTSLNANLDFERKSSYVIKVRATDDGKPRLSVDKNFTIKVNDLNERPTDILLSNNSVPENSPNGFSMGSISVIDPDNLGLRGPWQSHTCTIINNVPFIVNQSVNDLRVAGSLNYETTSYIDVIFRCQDNGSQPLYLEKTITVYVTDVNEAPTTIRISSSTVAENAGIFTIGRLDTIDPDNLITKVQTFTYSIINGSNVPFIIDGNNVNTTRSLNYEAESIWKFTIKSTDNKGLHVQKRIIITVIDQNDAPSGLNVTGPLSCSENSDLGTYLGTVSTVDEDIGQTFTYNIDTISAEGHFGNISVLGVFSISPSTGVLTLSSSLNFEYFKKYRLLIRSVDSGTPPQSVTGFVNVDIKDINEPPTNITLNKNTVNENSPIGTVVGNLSVHDPDNAVISWQQFSCQVTNPSLAPFNVTSHLILEVSKDSLDYETENTYIVGISCVELNGGNNIISTKFIVTVIDINEPPYNLTLNNASIPENGQPGDIVGKIQVLDPDNQGTANGNVSITIQSQTPNSDTFKIVDWNLAASRPLDYESVPAYLLTMIAQDSGNPPLQIKGTFNIEVINMNDPPTNLTLTSNGIYENATSGAVVGTLGAQDQDKGQTCNFSVVYPSDLFNVNGNELVLLKPCTLNYESQPLVNVSIKLTDDGRPPKTSQLVVIVKVLDSNDPPSDVTVTPLQPVDNLNRIMVKENSPSGTPLANLTVIDQDLSQGHKCMINDEKNRFSLNMTSNSTAQVFLNLGADLNYEAMNDASIIVQVQCTDMGSPPYSKNISMSFIVSDVNERPYNITLSGSQIVKEHAKYGTIVGSLSCEDPDFNQMHVFKVVGSSASIFGVNSTSLVLYIKDPSLLDYELYKGSINVTILVTDIAAKPLNTSRSFVIRIDDVNEAPYFSRFSNRSVREDIPIGSCIAPIRANDDDRGQNVTLTLLYPADTFTLSEACASTSAVNSSLRYLTNRGELSYDLTYPVHAYSVLIEAKDDGNPQMTFNETFIIPVELVNPCDTKDDCNGNATCYRSNATTHNCRCNPGFTGNGWDCSEIDECASNPCLNKNGICANITGYPCQGQCIDLINNYTCSCAKGFTGSYECHVIDYCESSPCMNNASCNNDPFNDKFTCYCMPGFKGSNCSVNIDECKPHNCTNHGDCADGINRFDCSCYEGYKGTKCQRSLEDCQIADCKPHEVCVPRDLGSPTETVSCFANDLVLPIYFKPDIFSLEEVMTPHWQYLFQLFVFKNMEFKKGYITGDGDSTDMRVTATDLYVVETSILSLYPLNNKRVRKATDGKISYSAVFFVVKYKTYGVPQDSFYMALKDYCVIVHLVGTDFEKKVCEAGMDTKTRLHITGYAPITEAQKHDDGIFSLHPYLYFVFAGIGGMLLLLFIIGVALYRHNVNAKRRDRAFRTHHELLDNDNLPTDVMQRHQLSNEGQGDGAYNPMYGFGSGLDDQPSFSVNENPIYSKTDNELEQAKKEESGFRNPMYESFRTNGSDKSVSNQSFEIEECAYQTPAKSTDAKKKKKKKKGKKKKEKNNDHNEIPDIASVNPMFANREIYNDTTDETHGDLFVSSNTKNDDIVGDPLREPGDQTPVCLYAVPKGPEVKNRPNDEHKTKDDTKDEHYAVPKMKQAHDVSSHDNLSGTVNIYDTPRKSDNACDGIASNLDNLEQPSDVVSAFGFTASKSIDGTSGQTDC